MVPNHEQSGKFSAVVTVTATCLPFIPSSSPEHRFVKEAHLVEARQLVENRASDPMRLKIAKIEGGRQVAAAATAAGNLPGFPWFGTGARSIHPRGPSGLGGCVCRLFSWGGLSPCWHREATHANTHTHTPRFLLKERAASQPRRGVRRSSRKGQRW
jgi:hypothetical protein